MKPTGNESPIIEIGGKLYSISELKKLSDKEIYSLIKKYRAEGSKKPIMQDMPRQQKISIEKGII